MAGVAAIPVERRGLLTFAVMLATIIQILDTTIANVALPHMTTALGASPDEISWVLTSYIVAAAIAIPITGWLSDRVGSRNLFLFSVAGFIIASALCGAAQNLPEMVAFRVFQGITAAFMSPLGQTTLLDINPPERHAKAMSIWGMGIMVGPISGPVIGGWLTDNFDWRWVFYVNVPFGVLCFALLWWLLPSRPLVKRRFDLFGFALLSLSLAAFQLMLDRGQGEDWLSSTEVWIEMLVAGICFWMFLVHMVTAKNPMFDRALFKDRNLLTASIFMAVMSMTMMGTMALLPTMLQVVYGHTVQETGVLLMSRGIAMVVTMMLITNQLTQRGFDVRITLAAGFAVTAYSTWTMSHWSLEMDSWPVLVSGALQGVGMGLLFMPVTAIAFSTLPPSFRTDASGVLNLARSLGASVGISAIVTLLARNQQISHADLASHIKDQNLPADPNLLQALGGAGDAVMAMIDGEVNRQALMIAYLDDFWLMAIVTALAIPLVLLLRKPKGPVVNDPAAAGH